MMSMWRDTASVLPYHLWFEDILELKTCPMVSNGYPKDGGRGDVGIVKRISM